MPIGLIARTLAVSILTGLVLFSGQWATGVYLPWWAQMFLGWPAGKIAIAWWRHGGHPWPY